MNVEEVDRRIIELKAAKSDTQDIIKDLEGKIEAAKSDSIGINHRIAELIRIRKELIKAIPHEEVEEDG